MLFVARRSIAPIQDIRSPTAHPRREPGYNRPVHGSRWEKRREPLPKAQRP
jgi:hypothetical protein